jgi:hypothetical protein
MDRPVTKRELREELAKYPTKQYLHENFPTKEWVAKAFEAWGAAILAELAKHTKTILEAMRHDVAVVDDKYKDLPRRVKKLEAKVFAPKRRRTR